MSSALQSALTSLQQNDYVSLAVLIAVGYDYVLTFPKEVEFVWSKPWTWVSMLFILVRYCGLYSLSFVMLFGSSFLPGPPKTCEITEILYSWLYVLFLGAADFMMILRVWAMYNRSRFILSALLMLFFLEIITFVIPAAMSIVSNNMSITTIQILNFSTCVMQISSPMVTWTQVATAFQITHGAIMCTLAIIQFVRQSLQMYRATKQWQINRYMNLFVKEGIFYFFVTLLYSLLDQLGVSGNVPTGGWLGALLIILASVPMYTLTPRFVLSMREMYARDGRGRREGGIDTAFGLSPSGREAAGSAMVFADAGQNEGSEDIEEVPKEVAKAGTSQPV